MSGRLLLVADAVAGWLGESTRAITVEAPPEEVWLRGIKARAEGRTAVPEKAAAG